MSRPLPNLDWLRVFAVTAETESFALAASRLSVTPGAVSQRIKALEAFLGVELFLRQAQGVRLTDAGRRYARRVLQPLDQLAAATRDLLAGEKAAPVRVTVLPALAQLWLGPRLASFHRLNEAASIEIWADPAVIDLRTSTFDVALRYGRPPYAGCDHRPILTDELVPVASPEVAREAKRDASGLPLDVPLLLDTYWTNDLVDWLQGTGEPFPSDLSTQTFSLYSMVVEAVTGGRGFMIGHTALIGDLMAQGRLVPLSDRRIVTGNQFHLVTRTSATSSPAARTFMEWILSQ